MNARFRLKDGWELCARTAPEAMGRRGPALYEVVLWEPDPDPSKDAPGETRLRTGASYSGDSWKECFRRLRDELGSKGWLGASLIANEAPSEGAGFEGPVLLAHRQR